MKMEIADLTLNFIQDNNLNPGIIQIGHKNSVTIATNTLVNNSYQDDVENLEFVLKEMYKQLTLPKLSWLDEGMDLALNTFYMDLQLDKEKRIIKLEEIFDCSCNRLLIEGKPGFGKTTLCIKLLHDWANNESYTEQFKLAFLIPLKNLNEEGLDERLAATIPKCRISKNILCDVVNKMGETVLIVLDGFDELSKTKRQSILKVVYRKAYCGATVVLTSRCGEFYVEAEDLEHIFGTTSFKKEFPNVKYTITGIDECEVSKFVNNISPHCDIERLKQVAKCNPELFQCPLFIIMFTFLTTCNEDVEKLNTKTMLYRSLFTCIMKNSLARDKVKVTDDFNLFDIHEKSSKICQEILQEFGEFILENSVEFNLQFDVCPLTEKVYKLGFLIKHQKISCFKTTSHFEAFHKSILEFTIAYSIWRKCVMINFSITDEILRTIVGIFVQYESAQILPFFFGLCEDKLFEIFSYLKSYVSIYWNVEETLWELVSFNKLSTNLLKRFCNFIPFYCYASSFSADQLKLNINAGHVKVVCLTSNDVVDLSNVYIPEIRLIVNETNESFDFSHLQGVRCSNFIIDFQVENMKPETFQKYLKTFHVIQSDRNSIHNLNVDIINKLPPDFIVDGIKINQVECMLSGKEKKEFDLFRSFTTTFKVKSLIKYEVLENAFTIRYTLLDLIPLLSATAEAVILIKCGERIEFNFKDLTVQERKEWYQITGMDAVISKKNCIKISYLDVNSPNRDLLFSILKCTSVLILRCLSNHLAIAIDSLPYSWPGYTYLREISLALCDDQTPKIWEQIKKFSNLQSLELQMMCKLKCSDHIDPLLSCILLSVTNISLHLELKEDIEFAVALIKKFKEHCFCKTSNIKSPHLLKTVDIISIHNCDYVLVTELLECIKLKLLFNVKFIVIPDVWADIVRKTNIDYSIFLVLHLSENETNDKVHHSKLPIAFSRSRALDQTRKISYIQIQLKNTLK